MVLSNLWSSLFGSGVKTVIEEPKKNEEHAEMDSANKTPVVRLSLDEEILIIARECGGLATGKTIEISLHRILELCPRERKKADAYLGLKRKLKEEYGAELVISSRTSKKEESGNGEE